MGKFIKAIVKYKLFLPCACFRLFYYNFIRFNRRNSRAVFFPTRNAVIDIAKSAKVTVNQPLLLGWCNMKYSRLETGLVMGYDASLELGGDSCGLMLIGYGSYIQVGNNATLKIGDSFINREVKIICNKEIAIGNGCIIAMGTVIRDNDGGNHCILSEGYLNQKPVTIGDHVWLGENSMVLKGVTIGEGSVIAASSVVTKDIPPHCLAAGAPAKVIRENID